MTVKLDIDRLVIAATPGRRANPAALKVAIERHLAALIEANGMPVRSARTSISHAYAGPADQRSEAHQARMTAQRIYEAMKR